MNVRSIPQTSLLALTSLVLIGALSRPPPPTVRTEAGLLLPRPALLHAVFAAQQNLIADFYWIRALNLIGNARTEVDHRDIYLVAELATELDPKFEHVYRFGGIAIPLHMPGGGYKVTNESTALLTKGVKHLPHEYKLQFQLAYNKMFFHQQYKEAAEILLQLSKRPESPPWLPQLATRLMASSGDLDATETLTARLRDEAESDELREVYDKRLREISLERILRQIDDAALRFKAREGAPAKGLKALFEAGDLSSLAADPLGGTLFLGQDGRGHSSANKHRLELITRPDL